MKWLNVPKNIEEYKGFVYIITHIPTGKYYIGQKTFWSKRSRPPLKGRKNKRHYRVESDWKSYWGSSNTLKADIKKFGKKQFVRNIIVPCETQFDCSYWELRYQMENDVLFDKNSYNEIVNVRLRRRK